MKRLRFKRKQPVPLPIPATQEDIRRIENRQKLARLTPKEQRSLLKVIMRLRRRKRLHG